VLDSVVIQLYGGERTPCVDRALGICAPQFFTFYTHFRYILLAYEPANK